VLSKGATYTPLALNAADTQLLESRQFGIQEISRILRIPPHKLYELSRSTNNNIEQQSIESVTDSIRPWAQRIENAINADPDLVGPSLPRSRTRRRTAWRLRCAWRLVHAGINGGWMMPSTPARLENLPAGPELEYYLRPLNMAVVRPGLPDPLDTIEETGDGNGTAP
jgi:phage portal protein BeeE